MTNYFPAGVTQLPGESVKDQLADEFDKLSISDKLNYAYVALPIDLYEELFEELGDDSKIWNTIRRRKEYYEKVLNWYINSRGEL